MKILQLGRSFNFGGTETVILNICKGLYNDEEFQVFVCSSGGSLEEELKKINIKHFEINDISCKSIKNLIKIIKRINSIVKSENIDIIHSHHRTLTILANITKIVNPNIKVIHTAHYMTQKNYLGRLLGKNIIAVGEKVKENLIINSKINPTYIKVIYNGIKINENIKSNVFEDEINKGIKVITSINRLSFEKGVDIFIDAIPNIVKLYGENIKVYIIGDGEERERLEKQTNSLNINKYVEFLGFKKNILEYIKSSDLIISTSRTEGLPILPLETFTQRKTIVATNVGGTSEIVLDNFNGILINDNSKISEKIVDLLLDIEYKTRLEENAFETVKSKFNLTKMIEEYKTYYRKL